MIVDIAGVNGAGKSSIIGQYVRIQGDDYFNPDEQARKFLKESRSPLRYAEMKMRNQKENKGDARAYRAANKNAREKKITEANIHAWNLGKSLLALAIENDTSFTFETTLGGKTITGMLLDALADGVSVSIFYVGLASPELHIERVKARVGRGGHDIPDDKINDRWKTSILNLQSLVEEGADVALFDNSSPMIDGKPVTKKIIQTDNGGVVHIAKDRNDIPSWAEGVVATILRLQR
jgi:predicted ABC-type ATPase